LILADKGVPLPEKVKYMIPEHKLDGILSEALSLKAETEIIEFKEAKESYDFNRIGKYFSALSNEANLKGKPFAWLIFGVEDRRHRIVGSRYRSERKDLDKLKKEIADKMTNNLTFIEIYELRKPEGRVVMFQIPAAPKGIPIAFEGHYYGRDGESLVALNIQEYESIRQQQALEDWSAAIVPQAGLSDLEPAAIEVARKNFKLKFPHLTKEIDGWDDTAFLNKVRVTLNGRITRTALILLGKEESDCLLTPANLKIRWILKDSNNKERDYLIVGCPMLLSVERIYLKIRNIKYRFMRGGSVFPDELDTYEPFVIREAINNALAHQNFETGGVINVVEFDDCLIFTNLGTFMPGSIKSVIEEDAPYEKSRNPFLARAMFNLNMVDTIGSGIRKIFNFQRQRFFPMPDYDFTDDRVKVTITGRVIDSQYAKALELLPDLTLDEVLMLDKVQKHQLLTLEEEKHLKKLKLIEGRKPNYYISLGIAEKTDQKAEYTKNTALDKQYYLDLILRHLKIHKSASRKEIDALLWNKLPEWMNEEQKKNKIRNLLSELKSNDKIANTGTTKDSVWVVRK
jgi:ATP-dependent DNA helicase RecG